MTRAWEYSGSALVNIIFPDFPSADIRRVSGGWYVFLRIRGIEHRLLLQEPPIAGATYSATLAFDDFFESRTHAARRLWHALSGRPLGPDFRKLPAQRRDRLVDALRALDARLDGATYRTIAEALFGAERVPARAWKTHDLRNRTIRLVQSGQELMRDGYFDLLRYPLRRR